MPKNPAEMGASKFEKGERIRFEDVQDGMELEVVIKDIDNNEKDLKLTGTVAGHTEGLGSNPRSPRKEGHPGAYFILMLADGTGRAIWENQVQNKHIVFKGEGISITPKDKKDEAPRFVIEWNDANWNSPGIKKMREDIEVKLTLKLGRTPTEEEIKEGVEGLLIAVATANADKKAA